MVVRSVGFDNPTAKASIYASVITLNMYGTTMKNMKSGTATNGVALQCVNCNGILIDSCNFESLKSELGGAIYITETENNKKYNDSPTKYTISNTKFTSN